MRFTPELKSPIGHSATRRFTNSTIAPDAARAVLEAVPEGRISPGEAETVLKLVDGWRQAQGRLESLRENHEIWGDLLPSLG